MFLVEGEEGGDAIDHCLVHGERLFAGSGAAVHLDVVMSPFFEDHGFPEDRWAITKAVIEAEEDGGNEEVADVLLLDNTVRSLFECFAPSHEVRFEEGFAVFIEDVFVVHAAMVERRSVYGFARSSFKLFLAICRKSRYIHLPPKRKEHHWRNEMKRKIKTSVSIRPDYLEIADILARQEDRSRSYIIDRIIEVGLATATAEGVENFARAMDYFRKDIKDKGQEDVGQGSGD